MAALQTYRDKNTGEIFAYDQQTGQKEYLGPSSYRSGVAVGKYSGVPQDISKMPITSRDGLGYVTQPPTPKLGVGDPGSWNTLRDAVTKIVGMKSGGNKDLTDAQAYWGTYGRETGNQFTNPNFNLLSPADQASINTSRMNVANANLEALGQERVSRDKLAGTAVQNVADFNTELNRSAEQKRKDAIDTANQQNDLLKTQLGLIKDKLAMGLPVTDKELGIIGVTSTNGRAGGTPSWRNNNPGNLKFRPWQGQYGGTKDANSAFAVFPSEEKAKEAYKDLLTSPRGIYAGLDNNAAMLQWSSDYPGDPAAYNYDKLVKLGAPATSKSFTNFTEDEWSKFFDAQKKAEGWQEGTIIGINTGNKYTETQIKNLAVALKQAGQDYTVEQLKKMSQDELVALESEVKKSSSAETRLANSEAGLKIQSKFGMTPDEISLIIMGIRNNPGNLDAVKKAAESYGLATSSVSAINALLNQ